MEFEPVPQPLNRCIGRQPEVAELKRLLLEERSRLITITGPGGIGKSRLALELAHQVGDDLDVSFVSLGPLLDNDNILGALGQSLGLADGESPGFLQRLRQLCGGPWLCVLDSFEHLLPQAPILIQLLNHVPSLQILVTSRSALRLNGEQVFPLHPLAIPPAQGGELDRVASVELFEERARAIRPEFQVRAEQRHTLADICRSLEGLPLALELAASRLELLSLEEINARLSQKLQLLEAGSQDAPPRHRTIRATIDWSYELLEEADKMLFRRLAVFSGGARLQHISAFIIEQPEVGLMLGVSRLLRHNLLRRGESAANTRLYFMEVIREYALERLQLSGEQRQVQGAFCALFSELARQARRAFGSSLQAQSFRLLAEEHENLNAALVHLHNNDEADLLAQIVADLGWYWESSGHLAEGLRWGRLAGETGSARALEVAGTMARHQGNYQLAHSFYREALQRAQQADDEAARSSALAHLAETEYRRGNYQAACDGYQSSLQAALKGGSAEMQIAARIGVGRSLWSLGQGEAARSLLEESLNASLEQGFLRQAGWSHNALGELARSDKQHKEATGHFLASERIFAELCDNGPRAILLQNLSFVQLAQKQTEAAAPGLLEAFKHWFRCGSQHGLALSLIGLAMLAQQRKENSLAWQMANLADRILEDLKCPLDLSDRLEHAALKESLTAPPEGLAALPIDDSLLQQVKRLTAPRVTSEEKSPLTAREQEVLQLLAQGLSNLVIAEQLHISRHTVTVHLRTIYDKLSLHSRSAATRWALDHGLA